MHFLPISGSLLKTENVINPYKMTNNLPAIFESAGKKKTKRKQTKTNQNSGMFGKYWFCNTLIWFPQEWFWHKGFPGEDQHDT